MKTENKNILTLALLLAFSFGLIMAVSLGGCATGAPPTKLEQQLFTVQTNYIPVVRVITNYQTETVTVTNIVPVTTTVGVTNYTTNVVATLISTPTVSTQTVQQPSYTYSPNANAGQIQAAGGAVGSLFGVGGLVGTALGGLFSLWGYLRSAKNGQTAGVLAQEIETARQFMKQLPNGQAIDASFVSWLSQHQSQEGVVQQVIGLINNQVSNPEAQVAAQQLSALITSLQGQQPAAPATSQPVASMLPKV